MAVIKAVHSSASIGTAVRYIERPCKTSVELMTGLNCSPETAAIEMITTKKIWSKLDGRSYNHYVQSFAPEEDISPEEAHFIAVEWARQEFPNYEVVVATHTDTRHLHSHVLVNAVSYVDGHKIHTSSTWLEQAKQSSDEICRAHGLSITRKGYDFEGFRRTAPTIWSKNDYHLMERARRGEISSYICDIYAQIDQAKSCSYSREEYIDNLAAHGISVRWSDTRRDITYTDSDGHRIRSSRLAKITGSRQDKDYLIEELSHAHSHRHSRS